MSLWRDLSWRARVGISAAALAVVVGGPTLLVGPIVRARVVSRAASLGLTVEVASVRPTLSGIWLLGVQVRGREGRVSGLINSVRVPFGAGAIEVHGGRLRVRGRLEEVERSLAPEGQRQAPSGPRRELRVDGLDVHWTELDRAGTSFFVWGAGGVRGPAVEQVRADRVQAETPGIVLVVLSPEVALGSRGPGRLRRLRAREASVELDLDAPKPRGLEPALAEPPGAARQLGYALALETARAVAREALPEGAEVGVESARLAVTFHREHLGFGPSRAALRREAAALSLEITPSEASSAGATPLALRAKLPLGADAPSVELSGGPVSLAALGIRDGELGLTRTRDATLEAHLRVELAGGVVRGSGNGSLANVSLRRAELSAREVEGLRLAFRTSGEAALDGSSVKLGDTEVTVGDVKLAGRFELERDEKGSRLRLAGGIPLASCDAVLTSIPAALLSDARGIRLEGTFALDHALSFDSARPAALALTLHVENGCRIAAAPDELSPSRFRSVWTREVKGPDGLPVTIRSGPGTPEWLDYENLPHTMEVAVLVCEDGGFYRHHGFDFRAIEKAMKDDIQAGRFVRGASTISMQLAKNLYLGKEKTLSRKIEEALFTMLLESKLSKQELMALYLNVVELGPGIYGVEEAAKYYFDEAARDLSLGQALYLASILPDPTRQHFEPDGRVSPRWGEYIRKLMRIARSVDRINDDELEAGLAEELAFRKGNGEARLRELGDTEPASIKHEDSEDNDGAP
jgi:hypothetical protein